MNELIISVGSLVIGVVATVWVGSYYFRKSLKKSLTPYIQYASSPFRGIDPIVKQSLRISYQQLPVDNLFEIQYLIANTGEKAIRDVIEPLSLKIPEDCQLLDANIIHRHPEALRIQSEISKDRRIIRFQFPLMNSSDFFIVKLLLNGEPKTKDMLFSIVVDELPPTLTPQWISPDAITTSTKRGLEIPLLGAGLVFLVFGMAAFKVIYDSWHLTSFSIGMGIFNFLGNLTYSSIAILITIIPAFFSTLLGAMMSAAAFTDGNFPPTKRKFIVPPSKHPIRRQSFSVIFDETMNDTFKD